MNDTTSIRAQGRRKSNFPADTGIPSGATFDFVSNGANYKISIEQLQLALNVTGSIVQVGEVTSVPVLDTQGSVHGIRNLVAGDGIAIEITPENGIKISVI